MTDKTKPQPVPKTDQKPQEPQERIPTKAECVANLAAFLASIR